MNGGQLETYEQRVTRERAEREQQQVAHVQRQAEVIRDNKLRYVDEQIELLEPWVAVLTDIRAMIVEQLDTMDPEPHDLDAGRRAMEAADALDCIDHGPRDFGSGMLDVPTEVEEALGMHGVEPKSGLVSRSRFAGRTGLRKASRLLEELRKERGKLTAS